MSRFGPTTRDDSHASLEIWQRMTKRSINDFEQLTDILKCLEWVSEMNRRTRRDDVTKSDFRRTHFEIAAPVLMPAPPRPDSDRCPSPQA